VRAGGQAAVQRHAVRAGELFRDRQRALAPAAPDCMADASWRHQQARVMPGASSHQAAVNQGTARSG
jgi:hypothetical protein